MIASYRKQFDLGEINCAVYYRDVGILTKPKEEKKSEKLLLLLFLTSLLQTNFLSFLSIDCRGTWPPQSPCRCTFCLFSFSLCLSPSPSLFQTQEKNIPNWRQISTPDRVFSPSQEKRVMLNQCGTGSPFL